MLTVQCQLAQQSHWSCFHVREDIKRSDFLVLPNGDIYCKIASSNTSRLEAHVGFQIAYEGDFWSLCLTF